MKKFSNIVVVATMNLILLAGCAGGDNSYTPSVGSDSITLGIDPSRITLGEAAGNSYSLYWSEGDQIVADGQISHEAQFEGDSRSKAMFLFDNNLEYPCNILYPASFYAGESTITLPVIQSAATGTFATSTLPMATTLSNGESKPVLHHLAGAIHLRIKASAEKPDLHPMLKVEFRGCDNEQVCGNFEIDYNDLTLTPLAAANEDRCVVTRMSGPLSISEVTDVYVVVPARLYSKGFKLTVVDKHGHYMEKIKGSAVEIKPGEILAMPVFDFEVTGTMINVQITP